MSKESPLSLNEHQFIRQALSGGLRVDGRGITDMRHVTIEFPGASGSVEVRLGQTRVHAITTADLVAPFPDRPTEGMLNLHVNFSPMASPVFEAGFQGEKGVEIARILDRGIRESRAIDTESLCVLAGEKVWSIRVDLHVLDQEGNMLDAVNLAAVLALLHFRRPDVTVVGESVTVHSVDDRQPVAIALHHIPIACTFAFYDPLSDTAASVGSNSSVPSYLIDPSLKEESVADGSLTCTLNVHGELCCLQKGGGVGIEADMILQCTQIALAKTQELTALIQQRLKEDAATHNTGNAIRGAQPVFHAPAKPIDAFGVNVMKPAGQHQVAGKPIEINMAAKDAASESDEEDDDDNDESDDDNASNDTGDGDVEMQDADQEFAEAAKKLQAKSSSSSSKQASQQQRRK